MPNIYLGNERLGRPPILIRNVLANFFAQGWMAMLSFLTTPYIVHHLGVDEYGLLSALLVLLGYFWLFDRCLGLALMRYVSAGNVRADRVWVGRLFQTSLVVTLAIGMLGVGILFGLSRWFVERVFHIPSNLADVAFQGFLIGAGIFAAKALTDPFESLLQAMQRFDVSNAINVSIFTIQKVLMVVLLMVGFSLSALLDMMLFLGCVSIGIYAFFSRRIIPDVAFMPRWNGDAFRCLMKFASTAAVGSLMAMVATGSDKLLLGVMLPIGELAYYTIAFNLASVILMIPGNIVSVLFAPFSESHAIGEASGMRRFLLGGTRYIMAGVIPPACLLFVFADQILVRWMGEAFAARSTETLQIFALAIIPATIGWMSLIAAQATGRPDIPAKIHTLQAVLNVALCIWLIPLLGINGAALAWLVNHLVGNLIMVHWVNSRLMNLSSVEFLKEALVKPVACGLVLLPLALLQRLISTSLPGLILSAAIFLGVSGLANYAFVLNRGERLQIRSFLFGLRTPKAA